MTECSRSDIPLCVDLDGTLIRTDLLWESLLTLVKRRPASVFWIPLWLLRGRAYLKDQIARRVQIDVASLPYNRDVIDYLRKERQGGRELILATASHVDFARQIAAHLGLFDGSVLGTTAALNLKGPAKLKALQERCGSRGFDYIGDARADLSVWAHANQALVVTDSPSLVSRVKDVAHVGHVFDRRRNRLRIIYKALRVHQWAKNVLILVPLISSHQITDVSLSLAAMVAFVSFSLCASAVYILNDCLDLEADRRHPKKKDRPFASGELSIATGLAMSLGCLTASFTLAALLPPTFLIVLGGYLALTTGYSLYLKSFVLVDVIVLAQLYTLRVYGGRRGHRHCAVPLVADFLFVHFSQPGTHEALHRNSPDEPDPIGKMCSVEAIERRMPNILPVSVRRAGLSPSLCSPYTSAARRYWSCIPIPSICGWSVP